MTKRSGLALLVLALAGACGRTQIDKRAADASPVDSGSPAVGCQALQPLADQGVLTAQRTRQVLFAPDRSWLVLQMQQTGEPGIGYPDRLVRIELPSGSATTLSQSGGQAEALGTGGALLLSGLGDGNDRAIYDSRGLRTIASGVCQHKATPDGSRVYLLRDCGLAPFGTLEVVDVASGTTMPIAKHVLLTDVAISPDSQWAAFVVRDADAGWQTDTVHLVHKNGRTYALASQPSSGGPQFVSNQLLLFDTGNGSAGTFGRGNIRGHEPGSGDTSYLVASERGTGLFGYKVSADGAWLLGAALATSRDGGRGGSLYAIRLSGSIEHKLTSDLLDFWLNQMAIDAFAWSGDGTRAIYLDDQNTAIWASDPLGTSHTKLSDQGWFSPAATGDQVILLEAVAGRNQSRLRVVALGSGADVAGFDSDGGMWSPTFLPDGRGLLFANRPKTGPVELRFIATASSAGGGAIVLGRWNESLLRMQDDRYGGYLDKYPIDPTGCFTLVDTDLAPGPGTRLVLLP